MLLTAAAPSALANDKRCKKDRYYTSDYRNDYYDNDRDDRYRRNRDYDDDGYYRRDRRNGSSREVLRDVGIGTAVGAGGGLLLGGKKGALIGAAIGAAGGYVYNRGKKNRW
ncbi:MAG: hypothetical protein HYR56_15695 [Acidobacteria bacterium]|nr:hypothetical protein [Acidobacteriota bacterium]